MVSIFRAVTLHLLFVCLTLSSITLSAQEKVWDVDLFAELNSVNWIQQGNDGTLLAAGDKALLGLDHQTGKTLWTNTDLKAVSKNSFFNVEGLPIAYLEYSTGLKNRGAIINVNTGEVYYDTGEEGLRIQSYTSLPEQNSILFEATEGKQRKVINFDLKTLTANWSADAGKVKGMLNQVMKVAGLGSFISQGPMFTKAGELILGIKDQIHAFDFATGERKWQLEVDKDIKALVYSPVNNSLYLGIRKSKKLTVLEPSSGEDITPGKLKLKGTMLDILPDADGNLILVETEGFNLIDPATNDLIWKKSYKIEALDEVIPYEKGFIAIGKTDKGSEVHYTDKSGKKIWDTKVKGYAYFAVPTPKGVMYISTERSNILSFDDGKDVWDKDVKFKSIPAVAYDEDADQVFLFENKNAYRFSFALGKIELIGEDLELEKVQRSTPLEAESLPAGYFVYADQHASLIDRTGKIVYTSHYKPMFTVNLLSVAQVGLSAMGVDLDVQGAMSNIETMKGISNGSFKSGKSQSGARAVTRKNFSMGTGSGAGYTELMNVTSTRLYNSLQTKDFKFLTAQSEDGTKKAIYMIDKATGKIVKQIALTDKDPGYEIDELDNLIFVNEKNRTVTAYKM
jgi:outer membrane protein assembly factor BamB